MLATVCLFALCNSAYCVPTEAPKPAKEVKEPKDIKEAATASKDVKDAVKAAKDAKKTKKECAKDCGTTYDPICAHDPADAKAKPKTFGSQCALDVANCEMSTSKFYSFIFLFSLTLEGSNKQICQILKLKV